MSYRYPTADVNSAGESPDPITGDRLKRANDYYDAHYKAPVGLDDYNPFASWKRIGEDLIHFTPFDSLPQEERDAIRVRRRRNFQNSHVPWIVSDYTTLLTAYDDVDDLMKTKTLIQDYALTPAAKALKALGKKRKPFHDKNLEGWDASCGAPVAPRERKLVIPGFGGLNFLATLGLGALGVLFPSWRLASLLFQALQTTDSLFGVGIQLGPVLGFFMEAFFRGASNTNGPILTFDNKWEQLKAARVLRNGNKALAAAPHAHPDDAFTSLTGFYYGSDADILPTLVIDQDDYPSVADVFENPWALGKEGFDFARLAASLPYNLGALAVNNLLGDALTGMSKMLGGGGDQGLGKLSPDNETAALMRLAELGICPGNICEGQLAMNALLLSTGEGRTDPTDGEPMTLLEMARNLYMHTQDPQTLLPEPITTTG
jgi:hypothetical protein